ncbi:MULTISPECIES: hypothetical protein [unclassified Spirosoma]|uniref:hypothetical protein n=1 Tax=unclassified Spirosoma TaxID=2621999 RepID=UPI00095E5A32|nr:MULTISPECIES: hypothetical protein [unclassified Spirosoma]MBN8825367.1 hypothetical protein [Spirosoma sp.]OJW77465.1 MAG: hypothetical protein BGO59_00950 [Spirosoma sp. 48-14]
MKTRIRFNQTVLMVLLQFVLLSTTALAHTTPNESADARQAVVDFLHWYKANLLSISKIYLVDQKPGKPYAVNFKHTERYLSSLKSSQLLTDSYLAEWRTYFKQRQEGFQLSPQNEGPPTGFEYDLVMLSQDVDAQMDSLKTLKIRSVKVNGNRATVKFFLLEDYEFRLIKINNRWLINEILNLSAE